MGILFVFLVGHFVNSLEFANVHPFDHYFDHFEYFNNLLWTFPVLNFTLELLYMQIFAGDFGNLKVSWEPDKWQFLVKNEV